MPLSPPADREALHCRRIEIHGYRRADGLFDIEAHLHDSKSYGFANQHRGWIAPGEPLHEMWIRLTIDETMVIRAVEAASDHTPYAICPEATPHFARLVGLSLGPGFNRAVRERVGGILGCTHLRELLAQMATVAYQTLSPLRHKPEERSEAGGGPRRIPPLIGTCIAYAPTSPVVRQRWPWLSTTAETAASPKAAD